MAEREFSPARLEAISDGVIAVAITIMVLELHAPEDPSPAALLALWPKFLAYIVSFAFVAIYWVNHRYLFRHIRAVDDRILWCNMGLLFLLSLIPFATAYMGENGLAPFPTAVDAVVMLLNGVAYGALRAAIAVHIRDPEELALLGAGPVKAINTTAVVVYALAIGVAFFSPLLSLAMNFAVSVMYMTPYARPDRA